MILSCEARDLKLPVLSQDAIEAAQELRELTNRDLPLDSPPSRRRQLERLLGLIADYHSVEVPECGWEGSTDDLEVTWVGRSWVQWTCPRCGNSHEDIVNLTS